MSTPERRPGHDRGHSLGSESTTAPSVAQWATANLGLLATLSGLLTAILYGFLRVAYSLFYREFGVTPEEVGLGQAEILAESLLGTLINFLFSLSLIVYILILLSVTGILWRSNIQLGLQTWADIHRLPRDQRRRTLMYLGLLFPAIVLSLILINRAPAWLKTLMIVLGFAVASLPVGMALIRRARGWVHGRKPKPASNGVRPGKETQPQ